MLMAIGDTTTAPAATTPVPGLTDGLKLWLTPGTAFSAIKSAISQPSVAFSSTAMPFTIGLLAVPAAALVLVLGMGKKGR